MKVHVEDPFVQMDQKISLIERLESVCCVIRTLSRAQSLLDKVEDAVKKDGDSKLYQSSSLVKELGS